MIASGGGGGVRSTKCSVKSPCGLSTKNFETENLVKKEYVFELRGFI